jgi:hypothetical protein
MKENEIGRACSTHGRTNRCIQIFGRNPEGKRPLGRLGIDEKIILK